MCIKKSFYSVYDVQCAEANTIKETHQCLTKYGTFSIPICPNVMWFTKKQKKFFFFLLLQV